MSENHNTDTALEPNNDETNSGPALMEKFVLRLPPILRDQIRQLSQQNRRSMNSEIIMVLESYLQQQFVQQMTAVNAAVEYPRSSQKSDSELGRMLLNLPREKKAALLELLG